MQVYFSPFPGFGTKNMPALQLDCPGCHAFQAIALPRLVRIKTKAIVPDHHMQTSLVYLHRYQRLRTLSIFYHVIDRFLKIQVKIAPALHIQPNMEGLGVGKVDHPLDLPCLK